MLNSEKEIKILVLCFVLKTAGNWDSCWGVLDYIIVICSVADPDPPDPHVFGPPGSGSGSTSQRYGSGSIYQHAKIVRKTLIPSILLLFFCWHLEGQ